MIVSCALALVASAHLRADVDPVPPLGTVAPLLQHEADENATSGYDIATVAYSGAGVGGCKASTVHTDAAAVTAEADAQRSKRSLSMSIAVMTLPQNVDRRDAIRQTWKRQVDGDPAVEVHFVMCAKGVGRDNLVKAAEENARYGDLQVLDCWEGYGHGNLTLKVYAAMEWFANKSHDKIGPTVFMKVDDDTLIRAGAILEVARRTSSDAAHFYMGYMYAAGQAPQRDAGHRWYEPCEVFKGQKYPTTASGSAYALSGSLVQRFVHQDVSAVRERLLWNEDRAVATWVQFEIEDRHIPVTYVNLPGATNLQQIINGQPMNKGELNAMDDWRNLGLLVVHKMYPKQMICVWQRMQRGDAHAADCFAAAMKR